jgi:hypothetical protein
MHDLEQVLKKYKHFWEVRKVSMVDVLLIHEEHRIFTPVEITMRTGLREKGENQRG